MTSNNAQPDLSGASLEDLTQMAYEDGAMKAIEQIQVVQQFYNEKPKEGEMDLVEYVRSRFAEHAVSPEVISLCFDQNNFVVEATGRHTTAQQWNLTRWIDDQFTLVQAQDGIDTRLYRYQVIYEVGTEEWIKIFNAVLLPNLLEFGLRQRV